MKEKKEKYVMNKFLLQRLIEEGFEKITLYKYSVNANLEIYDNRYIIVRIPNYYPFIPELSNTFIQVYIYRHLYTNFVEVYYKVIDTTESNDDFNTMYDDDDDDDDVSIENMIVNLKQYRDTRQFKSYKQLKGQIIEQLTTQHQYCPVKIMRCYLSVNWFKTITDEITEIDVPEDTSSKFFSMLKGKKIKYFQTKRSIYGDSEGLIKIEK